jgi:hypothetical protein
MNFKVGDRVRIRADIPTMPGDAETRWGHLRGTETKLVARAEFMDTPMYPQFWLVEVRGRAGEPVYVDKSALAPLTPPAADEWAADKVKQVTKPSYLEPVRTKEAA